MIDNKERLQKGKELIRFLLNQAKHSLEQAKMQCLFIHPSWQSIEEKIQETMGLIDKILETSQKSNGDEKSPRF